jgi:hypothetical protein
MDGKPCQNLVQISVRLDAVTPAAFHDRVDDGTAFVGLGVTERSSPSTRRRRPPPVRSSSSHVARARPAQTCVRQPLRHIDRGKGRRRERRSGVWPLAAASSAGWLCHVRSADAVRQRKQPRNIEESYEVTFECYGRRAAHFNGSHMLLTFGFAKVKFPFGVSCGGPPVG